MREDSQIAEGYRASRPWQSRTEFLVDESLRNMLKSEDQIRAIRPMNAPQNPFPDRTGFTREEWTIHEVMNIDRRTPTYRSWTSGFTVQRSQLSEQGSSAGTRNSMGAMW